jgi:crotonobetainyl-CoA:carnitine CoA-transferase CaiB-like acyl-CoA transferase
VRRSKPFLGKNERTTGARRAEVNSFSLMTSNVFRPLDELLGCCDLPNTAAEVRGDDPVFPTPYRVARAATAVVGAIGVAAAELARLRGNGEQSIGVRARAAAASLRTYRYFRLDGAPFRTSGEKTTGFFPVRNGRWIYLHCNFAPIRERTMRVLGTPEEPESVRRATATWDGEVLEEAVAAAGGCAAFLRSPEEWEMHAQRAALADIPVVAFERLGDAPARTFLPAARPLSGVRVLDITRVIAGPFAGRTLAEHGADVLKISRPDLPDSGMFDIDTGNGKRSAYIDVRDRKQASLLRRLIAECDVVSQSYRPGAIEAHGFGPAAVAALRPGIVYVTLSAWGHRGPWCERRGYDSVVQTANGMAARSSPPGKPGFMPVSAMDYLGGYLMALGAMSALLRQAREGGSWLVRVSLAGTGEWLDRLGHVPQEAWRAAGPDLSDAEIAELVQFTQTPFGQLRHLRPVLDLSATPPYWSTPPQELGSSPAEWLPRSEAP